MIGNVSGLQQTTHYRVVLPFYLYAAISFVGACALLFAHTDAMQQHYFQPHTLAISHLMALGWGTMIIMGASHQLLPVLIEGKLDDVNLGYLSFICCGVGIPLLVIGFYQFNLGWLSQSGAALVNIGVLCYLMNVVNSIRASKKLAVHAWFMAAAAFWLFATTFFGMLLVFNFTKLFLPADSVSYLSLHAHLGILGWFLLLVIGVASRLIPLFLISKYSNDKRLWLIFILLNSALIVFGLFRLVNFSRVFYYLPITMVGIAIALFADFCRRTYRVRLRRSVDEQMKISLISIAQMLLPVFTLIIVLLVLPSGEQPHLALLYGFCIFFGWLTAIILGMTFKTLPFIVWNKVYQAKSKTGQAPLPKDLFNEQIFRIMLFVYLLGFSTFVIGILMMNDLLLKLGALALLAAAIFYLINVMKTLLHRPKKI